MRLQWGCETLGLASFSAPLVLSVLMVDESVIVDAILYN